MCLFEAYLYPTVFIQERNKALINGMCLFKASSRNGGEHLSAKLDGQYKRLCRVVAQQAHKAQWHNERNVLIYARAECLPRER